MSMSPEQEERFRILFPDHSNVDLAAMFGISKTLVATTASNMNLKKSEAYMASIRFKKVERMRAALEELPPKGGTPTAHGVIVRTGNVSRHYIQ